MNVKVVELRAIVDQLCTHLEQTGRDAFEVDEDFYWMISKNELYDPSRDPKNLTIGQLSDDWNELEAILKGNSPPIGYALVWLSTILRFVGEKSAH